ncbi:hypothetical protein [uncultured Mediterranean phage uvMED]|nr:hypothetical protein [uncultured Mediterranean phage uvMED]
MGYKSLTQLYNDFKLAVDRVDGLGDLHMINESEINKIKSFNSPLCVVEIPNSTISNINKAWEEYDISFFVLTPQRKNVVDYGELSAYYDECMDEFSKFIGELLKQRDGDYVIDKGSFEIERINDFSNHLLSGVKVNFSLLAPSYLGYHNSLPESNWTVTSNLIGLWRGDKNLIRANNALAWGSTLHSGGIKYLVHSDATTVPEYSSPTLTFLHNDSIKLTNLTFSNSNWSIFFKMSIQDYATQPAANHQTIFRITDPSSGDGFQLRIKTSGIDTEQDGLALYQIDEDNDSGSVDDVNNGTLLEFTPSSDLAPFSNGMIGLVNNASTGVVTLYAGDFVYTSTNAHDNQFTASNLWIGSGRLEEFDFNYAGLNGTISHIALYDAAVDSNIIPTIKNDLELL